MKLNHYTLDGMVVANRSLKTNGCLANRELTFLVKEAPAHFSIPLITGRGIGGLGNLFPTDDLCIGLDNYTNYALIYDLY